MKRLIILICFLIIASNVVADQVTTNYNLVIPSGNSRDWLSKFSEDIISIDTIVGSIISTDIANIQTSPTF